MEKKRLDIMLFEKGLAESRERAKSTVMQGIVYVNGKKEDKPGTQIKETDIIEIRGTSLKYVSRGGLKLEKAIEVFPIDLNGCVCMDIGASTGGFTDCMLQNGARKVFSVDVGYGQLAWKLRTDERVVNMEKQNIRHVTPEMIGESLDFCSIDVSFISLCLVLPVAHELLRDGGELVCLIKPQFEAGREQVGKKGVVRDKAIHAQVIRKILDFLSNNGFCVLGVDFSPIRGPEGNIEYLAHARKQSESVPFICNIEELVDKSHELAGKH